MNKLQCQPKNRAITNDTVTSFAVLAIIIGLGIAAFLTRPAVTGQLRGPGGPGRDPCAGAAARGVARVADAAAPLNIFIGRDGHGEPRQSAPLAVTTGSLCPHEVLQASVSDMVRSDGATLAPDQVNAWATADSTGTHVTISVAAAPRHGQVSGAGGYSGTVSLADPRAAGGNLLVDVHVMYPWAWVVIAFSALAAFGGFIWAWLVHVLNAENSQELNASRYFWRNFILRVAVVLAAAVPVVNVQFLANPDWEGTLSQFITLATLAGAAAIALTPTFRALALPRGLRLKPGAGARSQAPACPTPTPASPAARSAAAADPADQSAAAPALDQSSPPDSTSGSSSDPAQQPGTLTEPGERS